MAIGIISFGVGLGALGHPIRREFHQVATWLLSDDKRLQVRE